MKKTLLLALGLMMTFGVQTTNADGCTAFPYNLQTKVTGTTCVLTWDNSGNADAWGVEYIKVVNGEMVPPANLAGIVKTKTFTLTDLQPNTCYRVGVSALCWDPDEAGDYEMSEEEAAISEFCTTEDLDIPSSYKESNGWVYYDDGVRINNFGNGSGLHWGIMYPANSMNYTTLYKVAFYEHKTYNTDPITCQIRLGGDTPDQATLLHSQTAEPAGKTGWHVVTLSAPINFDNSQNLWIILSSDGQYPAMICADAGDPNSRWVSLDGTKWYDLAKTQSQGVYNEYSFMVRACFVDENQGVEEVLSDQVRSDKVLRNGQLFILRGDKIYTVTGQEMR